jgi:hypothetical protein
MERTTNFLVSAMAGTTSIPTGMLRHIFFIHRTFQNAKRQRAIKALATLYPPLMLHQPPVPNRLLLPSQCDGTKEDLR